MTDKVSDELADLTLPLNPKQTKLLQEIRKDVAKELKDLGDSSFDDDLRLWRFIRGFKYDRVKSAEVIRNSIAWRKKRDAASIASKSNTLQESSYPFASQARALYPMIELPSDAVDRKGALLWWVRYGKIDPEPLQNFKLTLDELEEYLTYRYEAQTERLQQLSKKTNRLERYYIVLDLAGLSMKHTGSWCRQTFKKVSSVLSSNYCESTYKITIINAPLIFRTVWSVIKPWLPERTVKKITIVGGDYLKRLKEDIDPMYIPEEYGGKCKVSVVPALPRPDLTKYTKKVNVLAGKKDDTCVFKMKKGENMRWRIVVANGKDIDFTIRFEKDLEVEKRSGEIAASGRFAAPSDGTLYVLLDNSRAWMVSRDVEVMMCPN